MSGIALGTWARDNMQRLLHCTDCQRPTVHFKVGLWSDSLWHCGWCNTLHTATTDDIMSSTAEERR